MEAPDISKPINLANSSQEEEQFAVTRLNFFFTTFIP
jgi:hypothetical protein